MKLSKHQIIDETAAFYNLDNRSVRNGKGDLADYCLYNGPGGKTCAFGRMLVNANKCLEGRTVNELMQHRIITDLDIKEEYRGHGADFYRDIQILHDKRENWTHEGLSQVGKERVEFLKSIYPDVTPE